GQANNICGQGSFFDGGSCRSLYLYDNNATDSLGDQRISNCIFVTGRARTFSFDFNVMTNVQNPSFLLYSGSTIACSLRLMDLDGTMKYNNGTELVSVSPYVLSTGCWYRVKMIIHGMSTSSDTFDIKVWEGRSTEDGILVIDKAGLGFRNNVDSLDKFTFGTTGGSLTLSGAKFYIDNIKTETVPEPAWKTYYVTLDGVAAANGLSEWTPTTLTQVRTKIRKLPIPWQGDVDVVLNGGFFYLDDTLKFDERDSGQDGYKVIYRNDEEKRPTICLSTNLNTSWTVLPSGIWRSTATFNEGGLSDADFRDLATGISIPNKQAVLARSDIVVTNALFLKDDPVYSNTIRVTKSQLITDAAQALEWGHALEMKVYNKFSHTIFRIESIDQPSGSYAYLIPRESERTRIFNKYYKNITTSNLYYNLFYTNNLYSYRFQNSTKFIDEEGEFYKGGTYLYYKPRAGETTTNLVVSVPTGTLVTEVKGVSCTNRVHDIVFRGITFAGNTWNEPSTDGFLGMQAVGYFDAESERAKLPLAVSVENADRIDFVWCRFDRLATTALGFYKSTANCDVEGCYFRNVGGAALELYGAAATCDATQFTNENQYVQNCRIANNYMESCGAVYEYTPALVGVTGPGNLVAHNEIAGGPYTGISWGWSLSRPTYAYAPLWDNEIKANYIHNTFQYIQDGAGIYIYGNHQADLWIFENYIENLNRSACPNLPNTPIAGLYFDQGTYEVVSERNVITNIDHNLYINYNMPGSAVYYPNTTIPVRRPFNNYPEDAEEYYDVYSIDNDIQDQSIKDRAGIQPDWISVKNWTAAPLPGVIKENVALNRKVSSNYNPTHANNYVDRGVDNDTNTIWASGSQTNGVKPEYTIEFNRPMHLAEVELVARPDTNQVSARHAFVIQGSTNGADWVELARQDSSPFSGFNWSREITNNTAYSYIRLKKTNNEGMNFAEFRCYTVP
ncbi:MAG: discoidin domain-containing protein, partial [Kiritimatiellales bacterium]